MAVRDYLPVGTAGNAKKSSQSLKKVKNNYIFSNFNMTLKLTLTLNNILIKDSVKFKIRLKFWIKP